MVEGTQRRKRKGETLCIKRHFILSEKWKLKYFSRHRGSRGLKKEVPQLSQRARNHLVERLESPSPALKVAMTSACSPLSFTCHAITSLGLPSMAMKAFKALALAASLLLGTVAFAAPPPSPSLELLSPEVLNNQHSNLTKTFDETSLNSSKYICHPLALA